MALYHTPVLLHTVVESLHINPDGIYVDVTMGAAGHSEAILAKLGKAGKLIAFDQDEDAISNAPNDERVTFVHANFRFLKRFLRLHGISKVDGILADLGVSSHQLDVASRGFSFRFEGPLDMRMHQAAEISAADLLNRESAEELQQLFSRWGEVRNAKSLAAAIVFARAQKPFSSIQDLLMVLGPLVRGKRNRYLAQVFQALRIAVNEEMDALEDFLNDCAEALNPGGRLVVIAYHSVEDRLVKHYMRKGTGDGSFIKNEKGVIYRPFKEIGKSPVLPDDSEILANPRARSARLRVAEKR